MEPIATDPDTEIRSATRPPRRIRHKATVALAALTVIAVALPVTSWLRNDGDQRLQGVAAGQPEQTSAIDLSTLPTTDETISAVGMGTSGETLVQPPVSSVVGRSPAPSSDKAGPTLESFTGGPFVIDSNTLGGGSVELRFAWKLTDPSGIASSHLSLVAGSHGEATCNGRTMMEYLLDNFTKAGFSVLCYLNRPLLPGTHPVRITATDRQGNSWEREVTTVKLVGDGWTDVDPPQLTQAPNLAFTPVKGQPISVTWQLTDVAGIMRTTLWFRNTAWRQETSCEGALIAGTPTNGTYQATCVWPAHFDGTYTVDLFAVDFVDQQLALVALGTVTSVPAPEP